MDPRTRLLLEAPIGRTILKLAAPMSSRLGRTRIGPGRACNREFCLRYHSLRHLLKSVPEVAYLPFRRPKAFCRPWQHEPDLEPFRSASAEPFRPC